jgi:hypothetical protein
VITNADQGVLLTWSAEVGGSWTPGMAVTTGASASLVSAPAVSGGGVVTPWLQAQDGSYVGEYYTYPGGASDQANMVSFDTSGNVRWVVPNVYPQIATADGGVIAQAWDENTQNWTGPGLTYDANGNATGQVGALPTYSWKGAYQVGSIDSIVSNWWHSTTSFWATVGGNLTGNGTALLHSVFTLNWCANNSCQLAYAPLYGGPSKTDSNVDFYYQMARQGSYPTPSIELGSAQTATVMNTALAAFQKAFQAFPARVLSIGVDDQRSTNLVEVSGGFYFDPNSGNKCGLTGPNKLKSTVWYPCNLTEAQFALSLQDTDLSAATGSPSFALVLRATGEGIEILRPTKRPTSF